MTIQFGDKQQIADDKRMATHQDADKKIQEAIELYRSIGLDWECVGYNLGHSMTDYITGGTDDMPVILHGAKCAIAAIETILEVSRSRETLQHETIRPKR